MEEGTCARLIEEQWRGLLDLGRSRGVWQWRLALVLSVQIGMGAEGCEAEAVFRRGRGEWRCSRACSVQGRRRARIGAEEASLGAMNRRLWKRRACARETKRRQRPL